MKDTGTGQPLEAATEPARTNWAGNYTYNASEYARPESADKLEELLTGRTQIKAVGSRHSFNHLADTTGTQIDLAHLKRMELDVQSQTVTVGGGVTYGELAPYLQRHGFALANLASLPHISVAGACATGTHGSGIRNGCLATSLVALTFLDARGTTHQLSQTQDRDRFSLIATGLGAFGVITSLTLRVEPTFDIAQTVYEDLSFDHLAQDLRAIFGAGYSVSLFTDWQGHRATQAWVKRKVNPGEEVEAPATFFGATRQKVKLHPLPGLSAESCTEQQGIAGPWHDRLPHFRLDYTPSAGAELQTEYFVPFERGYDAMLAVEQLRDRITPHLLVSELRAIAADELPMSMCHRRESLALHFTWKQELEAVLPLLPQIEAQLAPFAARPHWAKLFCMPGAAIRPLYPEFARFRDLTRELDPEGKFRNGYLSALLS